MAQRFFFIAPVLSSSWIGQINKHNPAGCLKREPLEGKGKGKNGRANLITSERIQLIDSIELPVLKRPDFSAHTTKLYESGSSLRENSRSTGVCKTTIRKTLLKESLALRSNRKWRNGLYKGAPPYGYIVHDARLIEDPREQKIVRIMMDLCSKNYSLNAIAQHLNGTGVKPRRGSKWEHSTIKLIITRVTEVEEKL
ncbi:MAG: recombinase family protein [Bdellovibrionales bacterium]|nr:recombinase family protein [Bdellovibrionales bacterium]